MIALANKSFTFQISMQNYFLNKLLERDKFIKLVFYKCYQKYGVLILIQSMKIQISDSWFLLIRVFQLSLEFSAILPYYLF